MPPPSIARRRLLCAGAAGACAAWGLAGCASRLRAAGGPPDRLIDLRSHADTTQDALLLEMRRADVVLLGEQHDAPLHHLRRAELMAGLQGRGAVVVAEHLSQGARLAPGAAPLAERLAAAGFDARGWAWPLHQPLFAAVEDAGIPLVGGNLKPAEVRAIAREGVVALPAALLPLLRAAPLSDAAEAALDADLLAGHCGKLPAQRLMPMRLAQRARDAAMWRALASSGGRPAVLLAGNGHVRRDYGVAQLAAALAPDLRVLSVGFGELGSAPEGPYDVLWLTPPAQRDDPCKGFGEMPGAASAPAAAPAR